MNKKIRLKSWKTIRKEMLASCFIILSIFISSCSSCGEKKYVKNLNRKIIMSSLPDKLINQDDFNEIKALITQFKGNNCKLEDLSQSDSLIYKYIANAVAQDVKLDVTIGGPVVPTLNKIRFYIETSQSMGGYMNGGTDFQDAVNNLIGILGGEYSLIRFVPNTITSQVGRFNNIDDFRRSLTTSAFAFGGHSPIDEIFRVILDSAKINDINFFVTDGIMSGSDHDVNVNPQYNIQQKTLLMNIVRSRFDEVKDSYGVSVYGFKSRFNYDPSKNFYYFTFRNSRIGMNFQRRPFYIFVFGNKQLLVEINNVLKNNTFFRPEEELHFGIKNEPVSNYTLFHSHLPINERRSAQLVNGNSVSCNWNPAPANPVKFAAGFNLSELPDYVKTDQYLESHLRINTSNNIITNNTNSRILLFDPIRPSIDPVVEIHRSNNLGCSHYLDLSITNLYTVQENINIQLLRQEDRWYEDWSCEDDTNIQFDTDLQQKTFNFKWLIYGIREAFSTEANNNFLEINIPVIRNN